jgi:hypothetical protein
VDRNAGVFVGKVWLMAKARKPKKPERDETREERISMEAVGADLAGYDSE